MLLTGYDWQNAIPTNYGSLVTPKRQWRLRVYGSCCCCLTKKKLMSLTKFSNQFTFRCSGKISQHFRGIYRHRKSIFFQISKRETRTMSTCNWLLDLETLGSQGEVAHVQNHWFWNGVWQAKVKWHRSWYVYFRSWVSRLDPRLFVQTDHFQSLIQDDVFAKLLIKPSFLIGDGNVWFKPKK